MENIFLYANRGARLPEAFQAVLPPKKPSRETIHSERDKALRRLIRHAYRQVPFYRGLFDRAGVDPREIRSAADLEGLPVTTKDDLRRAPLERIVARGIDPFRLLEFKTSGTSGTPFSVRCTPLEHHLLSLSWFRPLQYFGRRRRDKVAAVMYTRPGLIESSRLQEHIRRAAGFFPTLTIDMGTAPDRILKALRRYDPDVLGSYPGVLSRVADLMTERDRRALSVHTVWVGGEILTESMRRRISSAFRARVFNTYASEEFKLIGWECRETGEFHTCDGHLIVEVLREGHPVGPGERGELVVTNLVSYAMPFIRYRLGDLVTRGSSSCGCGLPFATIREVEGRTVDYFTKPDGSLLHPYDIARVILDSGGWIRTHQLVQERRDRIVLWVETFDAPSPAAVQRLTRGVRNLLGSGIEFEVIPVSHIQPDPSGKFRYARSLVA